MTLHPVAVWSVLTRIAVISIIHLVACAVGVPSGHECVADSLVGVVEGWVRRDDPDARLFQSLHDLSQPGRVEAELVDAGDHERVDPLGARGVEEPVEAVAIRHPAASAIRSHSARSASTSWGVGPARRV